MSTGEHYHRIMRQADYPNILGTYYYDRQGGVKALERLGYRPATFMSDSGGYSAWQLGTTVELQSYLDWCLEFRALPHSPPAVHVNLDVIPGAKGRQATHQERMEAVEASMANADRMRAAGLPVAEVYHQYEPAHVLDELLARRQPGEVLCIASKKDESPAVRNAWMLEAWRYLLAKHQLGALPPIHGLGVSSRRNIFQYPWWSVDTLAWAAPGMFGAGLDPRDGGWMHSPTRGRELRAVRCHNVLTRYKVWMKDHDTLWAKRGLSFTDTPETDL
jgi:hypothetical protein